MVGQLLGRSPPGEDGFWPAEAVRDVLEDLGTPELANGMRTGRYNGRGAVWRDAGSGRERTLAESYRTSARQLAGRYPFTARMLNDMAKMYDREATWHDTDTQVRRRPGIRVVAVELSPKLAAVRSFEGWARFGAPLSTGDMRSLERMPCVRFLSASASPPCMSL